MAKVLKENENSISLVTSKGLHLEIKKDVFNDMRIIDAFNDIEEGKWFAISKLLLLLLGDKQKKEFYAKYQDEDGRVTVEVTQDFLSELMEVISTLKN